MNPSRSPADEDEEDEDEPEREPTPEPDEFDLRIADIDKQVRAPFEPVSTSPRVAPASRVKRS